VTRDCHAGICGSRRVRLPPATRQLIFFLPPMMMMMISRNCRFSNSVSDSQMRCPPGVQLDIVTQRPCDIRFGMSAMKRTWSPYPILRQRVRSASHFTVVCECPRGAGLRGS
jgi:hypothetical protein